MNRSGDDDDHNNESTPKREPTMDGRLQAHSLIGLLERAEVRRAAELMAKDNIGALGIHDGTTNRLLGVVTERDIVPQ